MDKGNIDEIKQQKKRTSVSCFSTNAMTQTESYAYYAINLEK